MNVHPLKSSMFLLVVTSNNQWFKAQYVHLKKFWVDVKGTLFLILDKLFNSKTFKKNVIVNLWKL